MIQFNVRRMKNHKTEKEYFFPMITNLETSKIREVVSQIEKQCTLTYADVKSVLLALEYVVTQHLQAGHTIRLGNLGSFRPTIVAAEGAQTASGVNAKCIKAVRCRFTPSATLQLSLQKSNVELERVD